MAEQTVQPKISTPEAFFLISLAVIADCINWIPALNDITTLVTLPSFQLYFILRGVPSVWSLVGNLAEFIPGLSVLPLITSGVIATIVLDRARARAANLEGAKGAAVRAGMRGAAFVGGNVTSAGTAASAGAKTKFANQAKQRFVGAATPHSNNEERLAA